MSAGLADLQTMFQERLLTGADGIDRHLKDGGPFLKVYDHAYVARLLEVMGEDFPAVHTLLGDDEFGDAARGYVGDHPSAARSIRWLGQHFPAWLRTTAPWSGLPMLADMAAFEWALGLAFDAGDAPILDMAALGQVPPEAWPALRFTFHPSLNCVRLGHDVAPFQQAVATERDPESAPEPYAEPVAWAIWRDPETLQVRYRPLPVEEALGFEKLNDNGDFAALCEVLAASGGADDAALRAAGFLKGWLDSGWLIDFNAGPLGWS